jgi:hypothetical protein
MTSEKEKDMKKVRYNLEPGHTAGTWVSDVPGWTVTYPATCNGRVADLGFVASRGWGGSDFVHFDTVTGEPYGFPLTEAARRRLVAMRRDLGDGIKYGVIA